MGDFGWEGDYSFGGEEEQTSIKKTGSLRKIKSGRNLGSLRAAISYRGSRLARKSLAKNSRKTKKLGESWKEKEASTLDRSDKINLELKFRALLKRSKTENRSGFTKKELKVMFTQDFGIDIADDVFNKLFNLMDCDGNGFIDETEFAVTMCYLLHKGSTRDKRDLAYRLFDTNKDGAISKREFSEMMSTIFPSRLKPLLKVPAARQAYERFVEKELAGENLRFYIDISRIRSEFSETGVPSNIATSVIGNYIANNGEDQINISSVEREKIIEALSVADVRGDNVPCDIFDNPLSEITDMLERGSLIRFKKAVRTDSTIFTDLAWEVAGLKPYEKMSLTVFRRYTEQTPNLFQFLEDLKNELQEELNYDLRQSAYNAFNKSLPRNIINELL